MWSVGVEGDVSGHRAQVKEAEAGGWLIEIEEEVARAELNERRNMEHQPRSASAMFSPFSANLCNQIC